MSALKPPADNGGLLGRLTAAFVDSKLVPLIIWASVLLGGLAVMMTPSEEEPQIVAPMMDIHVAMPGATPKEMEHRVAGPMEKILWEIAGVEYVYSTSMDGQVLAVARFKVGEDAEKSLVKTYAKLYQHLDWIPPGCSKPIVKPRSIDDVPVAVLSFFGAGYDVRTLRTAAAQVNEDIRQIPGVAETTITGGRKRALMVELDQDRLRANALDAVDVVTILGGQNKGELVGDAVQTGLAWPPAHAGQAGQREQNRQPGQAGQNVHDRQNGQPGLSAQAGQAVNIRLDNFFRSQKELERCVVSVRESGPVFLGDVARVRDASDEPTDYVFFVPGPAAPQSDAPTGQMLPAVTLAVAKRAGMNATDITNAVTARVERLKGYAYPADMQVRITRDQGQTAKDKVHELLEHLALAALTVGGVVAVFLGRRASAVVMVAVPVTLAITLATYWLFGYTLNRVTLFALIFCIGILVDDPIVDVENIVRHLELPGSAKKPFSALIVQAVSEVRGPLVLATFTVIAAIMPMAFVGGLMGPYMRPMPVGASVAMLLSMLVAFAVTPWTAKRMLRPGAASHAVHKEDKATRLYRTLMERLIRQKSRRNGFLALVGVLLAAACSLFAFKGVLVKMLPFDNKSEFQVVVDMPLGTPLEHTAQVTEELARIILTRPEVASLQLYVGTSGPVSFSGLIRHYYLRQGQAAADITVNLTPKGARSLQSHDIAKAVRQDVLPEAKRHGARIQVVEIPPGPPVLQTLVAEIYGPTDQGRQDVARQVKEVFASTPGVVDVDWTVDDPKPERFIRIERDKALAVGVDPARALTAVTAAYKGQAVGLLHDDSAREDVPILVRLPLGARTQAADLAGLAVRGLGGQMVSLGQIASIEERTTPTAIYHKNLMPLVYVTGDVAGKEESPVYAMGRITKALQALGAAGKGAWQVAGQEPLPVLYASQPGATDVFSLKWDGEWQITYEVFRDMGAAFAVVMALIYVLVVGWFRSYTTPIAIMSPIPLSLIGIVPAHALAGAFFTATSMIGFIAGAGLVVRNSIILVDFIEMRRREGASLESAVVEAGAVRFRPMLLTAVSVVAGAFVILFDPIFQGLAISLMAGEAAATVFSRMVVPVAYYLDQRGKTAG